MPDPLPAPVTLSSTLKDCDGNYSSKRVAAFIALAAFLVFAGADQFTAHKANETTLNDLMWIIGGGLGLAVIERFAPKTS